VRGPIHGLVRHSPVTTVSSTTELVGLAPGSWVFLTVQPSGLARVTHSLSISPDTCRTPGA